MTDELRGLVALLTRPRGSSLALAAAIAARGGAALEQPLLEIRPLAGGEEEPAVQQLRAAGGCDAAIFVSTHAVAAAFGLMRARGIAWPAALPCLAIGEATRAALARESVVAATAGGEAMNSEELLAHPALAPGRARRVLIAKGEGGRALLAGALAARGIRVDECVLYRRVMPAIDAQAFGARLAAAGANAFVALSGETLQNLLGLLARMPAGTIPAHALFIVPGERVAALARAEAPGAVLTARNAGDAALLAALAIAARRLRGEPENP